MNYISPSTETLTINSSLEYCKLMLQLSEDPALPDNFDTDCRDYLRKLLKYSADRTIFEHLDELWALSPFPKDIRGFIHEYTNPGRFEPQHLMCKMATLRIKGITFEFLVEYAILKPDVEIYYGIKALSDSPSTTKEFSQSAKKLSDQWFDYIDNIPKRGHTAGHSHRHKWTNNDYDGTFWISWVRKEPDESMGKIVADLENKVFKQFKKFLKGNNISWDSETDSFERFTHLLSTQSQAATKAPTTDAFAKVVEEVERACAFSNPQYPDFTPLIRKLETGHYQFTCTNAEAKLFLIKAFGKTKPDWIWVKSMFKSRRGKELNVGHASAPIEKSLRPAIKSCFKHCFPGEF